MMKPERKIKQLFDPKFTDRYNSDIGEETMAYVEENGVTKWIRDPSDNSNEVSMNEIKEIEERLRKMLAALSPEVEEAVAKAEDFPQGVDKKYHTEDYAGKAYQGEDRHKRGPEGLKKQFEKVKFDIEKKSVSSNVVVVRGGIQDKVKARMESDRIRKKLANLSDANALTALKEMTTEKMHDLSVKESSEFKQTFIHLVGGLERYIDRLKGEASKKNKELCSIRDQVNALIEETN
jgi:hypothetical protein